MTAAAKIIVPADDVLARIDNLPTLPFVSMRVGELVNDPRVSAKQIADVLRQDPSLSAKVLRLVNSSYYAIPGGVTDVTRAISFLGFNTLHQLVLSVSVLGVLRTPAGSIFDARGLWLHSLAVGTCAEVIAKRINFKDPGLCFTAGLLHDLGHIALANAEPEKFVAAIEAAKKRSEPIHVVERATGLPSHDKIGVRLARRWKFPAALVSPIEFHHHDRETPEGRGMIPSGAMQAVDIVAFSDYLCHKYKLGEVGTPPPDGPDAQTLARLGLSPLHVLEIYSALMRRLEASKIFLELI